jgi:hypothetical protein
MSTPVIEMPFEVSNSVELQDHAIPNNPARVFYHRPGQVEIVPDTSFDTTKLEKLNKKKQHWGFLEGKDATLYLSSLRVSAPAETSIDIPSLKLKLSSLLPGDLQLERRARKLASQLSKGKRVKCEWDNVSLSELTPAEHRMSDEDFRALYPDHLSTRTMKGGRPKRYRTDAAQRKGHAERQRRYRERKLRMIPDVTKTTSQLAGR